MKTMEAAVKDKDEKLLKTLTYEVVDGKPIYYRGYKDVLEGEKHPEEVMGVSVLQSIVIKVVVKALEVLESKGYTVVFGEVGVNLGGKTLRSLDIGIFKTDDVKKILTSTGYYPFPPIVAVEVDVRAELEDKNFMEYVEEKVKDLLKSGTLKVIWILTRPKVILIFEKGKEGIFLHWDDEVDVIEGVKFKLSDLIQP